MPEAGSRPRIVRVAPLIPRRKAQHAVAPLVVVGLVPELLAGRAVDPDHVVDFRLPYRRALGGRGASGKYENRGEDDRYLLHGCLPGERAAGPHPGNSWLRAFFRWATLARRLHMGWHAEGCPGRQHARPGLRAQRR